MLARLAVEELAPETWRPLDPRAETLIDIDAPADLDACAALVACAQAGLTSRRAEVEFPGGLLEVDWREDDHVFLSGPAVCVFRAEVDEAWLSQLQAGVAR